MLRFLPALMFSVLFPVMSMAQGAQVAFGADQQDPSAPIEVTADALSVNQTDGTAIYTGNVLVSQGDMRMAAARVLVVYAEEQSAIDRIEATGGVTLVSGEEAAEADRAEAASGTEAEPADAAEKNPPVLKQFDRNGRRQDVVVYNPSYHELMSHSIGGGCTNYGYNEQRGDCLSHMTRAGLIYMSNQLEPGHSCPVVMTAAAIPVLTNVQGYGDWLEGLSRPAYDGRNVPISAKAGVTMGMSMTEKQGGSDVRANTTVAKPIDARDTGNGARYELWGHKWFTSAPMCDGFLTLAVTEGGSAPSCFLVPRWLPDGTRNVGFQVMQLKDKLADRSNASSEVEYRGAFGTMVGEEGRGVKHIIEMVSSTRLDCALGSAGTSRRALQQALHHVSERKAFGSALIDQPLMRQLLTDISVECEGHTAAAMRMAELWNMQQRQLDAGDVDPHNAAALRVGVAVAKYYVTKRAPGLTYECMEAFGGM